MSFNELKVATVDFSSLPLTVIKRLISYSFLLGIKELLYAFSSCLGLTLDNASAAVAVLKQLLSDYRKSVEENDQLSNPAVKQRLSICETLDDLLYLFENDCEYHNDPRGYFEMFLAKQIAASLLNSLQQDTSKEAVEAKAAEVMADKTFKRVASKLPIHNLKHAPRKIVESILGTMK